MSKMQAKKGLPSWCSRIGHYIIAPPLMERCEKQEWFKEKAKRRQEVEHREMLCASRYILDSRQNQRLFTDDDMNFKLSLDEEPREYKRNTRADIRKLLQCLLGEFIGTFILVFCCASMRVETLLNRLLPLENALGQGLLLIALIYSLGGISGAHFNPVVTLVFTLRGTFPIAWLPLYNVVQMVAAIVAGGVLRAFYNKDAVFGTNAIDLTILSTHAHGFGWETITSFFLVFVVLQTATRGKVIGPLAALAVGSINTLDGIVGDINSSSMNPVRALGPAIVNSSQDQRASLWVFIAGPYLGGMIALVLVVALNWGSSPPEDTIEEMKMAQGENK